MIFASDLTQHFHALPDLGDLEIVMPVQHRPPIFRGGGFVRLNRAEDKRVFSEIRAELDLEKRGRV